MLLSGTKLNGIVVVIYHIIIFKMSRHFGFYLHVKRGLIGTKSKETISIKQDQIEGTRSAHLYHSQYIINFDQEKNSRDEIQFAIGFSKFHITIVYS